MIKIIQSGKVKHKEYYFWLSLGIFLIGAIRNLGVVECIGMAFFVDYLVINFGIMIGQNIDIKNTIKIGDKEWVEKITKDDIIS